MYPSEDENPRLPRPIIIPNEMIVKMVDRFYDKVKEHPILGPIFDTQIGDRWAEHMPKMYRFWSSVLNSSGLYSGNPMQKHMTLKNKVSAENFTHWLDLFRETLEELFNAKDVEFIFEKAERIAQSLSLGMFFNPAAQH
ncbi:MAG: group III truncated hemoglobin [Sneathiella sp.]